MTTLPPHALRCPGCGVAIAPGARFCGSCGHPLADPAAATVMATPEPPAPEAIDPVMAALRQQLAGEYEVDRELGRGGMAIVYHATEVALGRPVALKILPPEMAALPSIAERFKREARLAASLSHPNIIDVYRVGQAGGIAYMAVRFIEGRALEDVIATQGALPIPALLVVLRSAVSALAYAHEHGIIHRDIKPGNILLDRDGRVTVSDFGIARAMEEAGITQSGVIVGTPYFMAPEQCAGLPLGPQCDQYAMGVVAFQMLTGSVPFTAESVIGIMHHHFSTPVPDVTTIRAGVPPELLDVLQRAMAKRAEDRYATTAEMLEAVEAIPLSEGERREGEGILRRLARGTRVSRIVTGEVTTPAPVIPGIFGTPAPANSTSGAAPSASAIVPAAATTTPAPPITMPPAAAAPPTGASSGAHDSAPRRDGAVVPADSSGRIDPVGGPPGAPVDRARAPRTDTPRVVDVAPSWPADAPLAPAPPVSRARSAAPPAAASGASRAIAIVVGVLLLAVVATGLWLRQRRADDPQRGLRRGETLLAQGRTEAARAWFQRVATDHPELATPHVWLARVARRERDLPAARAELERAVTLAPRDGTALREMGSVLFAEGEYELARRFFVRAVQANPGDRAAQGLLGCSLVRLGRVEEGTRFVERAGPGAWSGCIAR